MSEVSFGESVSAAYDFLYEVYRDIAALCATLTEQLSDEGWEGRNTLKYRWDRLDQEFWAIFHPTSDDEDSRFNLAIMIVLRIPPFESSKEALLMAVAVRFADPQTHTDVWNSWSRNGMKRVMGFLLERGGQREIAKQQLKPDFAPAASRASGFVAPLCGMTSSADVMGKVVKPILAIAKKLGA